MTIVSMMEQLGIKALRPGPSGNPSAPNQANYDEALANPYPKLPALLTLKNGKTVKRANEWWKQRRPEIVEEFEREIYGRIPKDVPKVTWSVTETATGTLGGHPVNGRQLVWTRRQLVVSGDQCRYPPGRRHARRSRAANACR